MPIPAGRIVRSVIEVERKFKPHRDFVRRLEANRGSPPFVDLKSLGRSTFTDIYYDHHKSLTSNGIWLRQRDGTWQAKVRQGGDFQNSQFKELQDLTEIQAMVRKYTSCEGSAADKFGLPQLARFVTFRRAWNVLGKFEIVMDETDFGHIVGEVELQREISRVEGAAQEERQLAQSLDRELETFMILHRWAFTEERPIGKLSAYFARQSGHPFTP